MNTIYLDHAATTPVDPAVNKEMYQMNQDMFGNPSSIHSYGREAHHYLSKARHTLADAFCGFDKDIIFTSSGTEANNLALMGTAHAHQDKGRHIITTKQEHHATLHTAQQLEKEGYDITYLPVYEQGFIHLDDLKQALRPDTILVSIMYVNNETGVIQPIREAGEILKDHQAFFHTDAVQAFGLLTLDVEQLGVDLLSVSAHKINGPKGIGCLYVSGAVHLAPMHYGGNQERKRRAGTENLIGAIGLQKAVEQLEKDKQTQIELYEKYNDIFLRTLTTLFRSEQCPAH